MQDIVVVDMVVVNLVEIMRGTPGWTLQDSIMVEVTLCP